MKCPRLFSYLVLVVASAALAGYTRNPVTGKKQLSLFSEGQEIEIGRQSDPEIQRQFGRVGSTRLQEYVGHAGAQLAEASHRPDLPWTFTVLDSEVVNAFALPGGYVYVTRQILAYMNNEAPGSIGCPRMKNCRPARGLK